MDIREIIAELKKPFPPQDHQERKLPGGGTWFFVPWQKIRDRLDDVCPDWQVNYSDPSYLGDFCVVSCTLTIAGTSRQAIGNAPIVVLSSTGQDASRGTPIERAIADAFKNAAEAFGVGAYLDTQSKDKREFTMRYMQQKGDGRAVKYARDNDWIEGSLPTAAQRESRAREERQGVNPITGTKPSSQFAISAAQSKRLYAIARNNGYTDAGIRALIGHHGFEDSQQITTSSYNQICQHAGDREMATAFNERAKTAV